MHFASNMAVIVIQLASVHGQVPMDKYMGTCSTAQVSMDKCLCTWLDKYMGTCPTAQVSMYLSCSSGIHVLMPQGKYQDVSIHGQAAGQVHVLCSHGHCTWLLSVDTLPMNSPVTS